VRTQLCIAVLLFVVTHVGGAAQAASAPAYDLVALAPDNTLIALRSDSLRDPRIARITDTDGTIIGIDVRPADGKLYGITDAGTLYTIDARTGASTRVSRLSSAFRGATASGFDFNPQSDRLRLVAETGQNLRVNVEVGAVAIDGVLTYASDDVHAGARPAVVAAGYTRSVHKTSSTVTFVIDHGFDTLVRQEPPNDGTLTTVGALGVDCGPATGFDIVMDARGVEHAFLICSTELYGVDIRTGKASSIGKVESPATQFIGLAVLPPR